ncbi:hypothetical protein PACTADRAFT_52030 [Pachysolen tannophilus NRRL Y-2460]|uniref:Phospholipid scramblase n=1 Tax=Pachysolen tannophilus NRRL Y-2460 TaxID=669874 RepID=A0A1E4TNW0_PACTA|nr:hypothetical protein PACTADRAFT_52030 [Pachysolen tannophilus NRRL Y-2460]
MNLGFVAGTRPIAFVSVRNDSKIYLKCFSKIFTRKYSPLPRYDPTVPQPSNRRQRTRNRVLRDDNLSGSIDSYTHSPRYDYPSEFYPPNPRGTISHSDPIAELLSQPTLVIERQLELMNVFLGFEQANKYAIMDTSGAQLGYAMERDISFVKMFMRQVYRLHRPFTVDVFDIKGNLLLTIRRPFSFINSHIKSILPGIRNEETGNELIVGESIQSWHLWRRRYNLFKTELSASSIDSTNEVTGNISNTSDPAVKEDIAFEQFGYIDAPFLSFEFPVKNENGEIIGSVDRNWVGIGRELFTDTGVYIMRMDPSSFQGMEGVYSNIAGPMTLDQRAIMLGTAISIDFDYFSRHSSGNGGLIDYAD